MPIFDWLVFKANREIGGPGGPAHELSHHPAKMMIPNSGVLLMDNKGNSANIGPVANRRESRGFVTIRLFSARRAAGFSLQGKAGEFLVSHLHVTQM